MTRALTVTKDLVSAEFRDAFERVTADSSDRVDSGPGPVMINSPEIEKVPFVYVGGDAYAKLHAYNLQVIFAFASLEIYILDESVSGFSS